VGGWVGGKKSESKNYIPASLGRAWSANFKMVGYVLLRPLRPELDGQDVDVV
jgi:hypothetical protein